MNLRIDLDSGRYWTMGARGRGTSVLANWGESEDYLDFMEDIASNQDATLKTDDGKVLAVFSLSGSRKATIELAKCVKRLTGRPLDPRGDRNPFNGNGNPF